MHPLSMQSRLPSLANCIATILIFCIGLSRCDDGSSFSIETLRSFSMSQVNYILGNNSMDMSYMVGFGNNYPKHVHHRASIPWDNQRNSCDEGNTWLNSEKANPVILLGAMVRGPD